LPTRCKYSRLTNINLGSNSIRAEGAVALANALQANTSVANLFLKGNGIDASARALVGAVIARNNRLRYLFLFDARRMLLSLMCVDECGVVWPYWLDADERDVGVSSVNVETLRAEFAAVVEERRRRADVTADADEELMLTKAASPAVKRRRTNR
jgi:hypothetical protein